MKTCSHCGSANDDALLVCIDCGTSLGRDEPVVSSLLGKAVLVLVILVILGVAVVIAPALVFAVPVLAIFYLPIYLPLLLSFLIKSNEWRGMRWALRVSTIAALCIWFSGNVGRPDFGNDVAGNIAGAIHNFYWTWGGGVVCALVSGAVGLVLHEVHSRRPNSQSGQDSTE